jgi:RsiW-degrading membrane proteinase PrsW (M82 family)
MSADPASAGPVGTDLLTEDRGLRLVRITAGLLCAFGAIVMVVAFFRYLTVFPGATVLAIVLQLPLLLVGFVLLRLLRPVRSPPLLWAAAATTWGATAAIGCALLANQGLAALWAKTAGPAFASNWSNSLSAPLNEEALKLCGVIMVVLAAPGLIKGPLDGMIFGALTGLGFQVVENVTYGLDNIVQSGATDPTQAVTSSWLLRLATAVGSHWAMTAVAGTGIGYLVARGLSRSNVIVALGYLASAMAMHLLFDAPHPAIGVKVTVNVVIVGVLYITLNDTYLTRARGVLARLADQHQITGEESVHLLKRGYRRWQLRGASSDAERARRLARQRAILERVEEEAA